jgi:hypothetical protein
MRSPIAQGITGGALGYYSAPLLGEIAGLLRFIFTCWRRWFVH